MRWTTCWRSGMPTAFALPTSFGAGSTWKTENRGLGSVGRRSDRLDHAARRAVGRPPSRPLRSPTCAPIRSSPTAPSCSHRPPAVVPACRHPAGATPALRAVPAPLAWTTLSLTIRADGSSSHELTGASPFPRHWMYGSTGQLEAKSGLIDFSEWSKTAFGKHSPGRCRLAAEDAVEPRSNVVFVGLAYAGRCESDHS